MKTIPLNKAFEILKQSSAVIVDGNALVYPSLDEITGDEKNEFLYISWTDQDDAVTYSMKFCEGMNQEVKIDRAEMYLYDTDSDNEHDNVQLTILNPKNLESLIL